MRLIPDKSQPNNAWLVLDQLDQGWSTRSFPHLISDRQLYVADNVVFNRDGLISKRPGSKAYGYLASHNGQTGSGVKSLSGFRFYPASGDPYLITQSNGQLYASQDVTGLLTAIAGATVSSTNTARYEQVYDPDAGTGATVVIVVDGAQVPHTWDGTTWRAVKTTPAGGINYLPPKISGGGYITPAFVKNWKYHLVYAGDPTDPTAVYIGDALNPEKFNGTALTDSAGNNTNQYYPAGRNTGSGAITGLAVIGQFLIVFYSNRIEVGYNTGTYGAYEFQWFTLSSKLGCVAPNSIVEFDSYVVFFSGDGFFATDGQTIIKLPDEIPSVYAASAQSAFPSEMYNKNIVVGARRGEQYLASYDNVGDGVQHSVVCFDRSANGGWTFGGNSAGGAWSRFPTGMPISWGVECRGPGDPNFPFYWGSSVADQIAQYDVGTYSDLGADIGIEVRCKAFLMDNPLVIKTVQSVWIIAAFPQLASQTSYAVIANPYVITDISNPSQSDVEPVTFNVNNSEVLFGNGAHYGDGSIYGIQSDVLTNVKKGFPPQDAKGYVFQVGFTEKSSFPFNVIAIVPELVIAETPEIQGA